MKTLDLVLNFADSMKHKSNGGNQDTLFSWFGDPNHITEEGTPWLFVSTTEPTNMDEYQHRVDINCKIPLCAAPIVKTEIQQ